MENDPGTVSATISSATTIANTDITPPKQVPRRGGRVACSFCHARRIRCNAFQSQPCSNCISARTSCQLIESKRGRYVRPQTKKSQTNKEVEVPQAQQPSMQPSIDSSVAQIPAFPPDMRLTSTSDFNESDDGGASRVERLESVQDSVAAEFKSYHRIIPKEGSEHLYARLTEMQNPAPECRNLQGTQALYLGESWLLTYVVQKVIQTQTESQSSSPSSLQVPLPSSVSDKPNNLGYDARIDPEETVILNMRGAFIVPEKQVSDKLIQIFFECVYPAFPIFDRDEFAQLYESNQQSLLILHAIYAIASTLCDEDVITKAGFENRNTARNTFLKRAKALHDADYETNKVSLVQAVFLLSFLWSGSTDEKDMFYWLSIAIGNAQGKGMHRSTKDSTLRLRDRRLWKRIWWSLYVRDRHCAVNIGRPMRIRDDEYDVEPLEESDFEDDLSGNASVSSIYGKSTRIHILYAIAMSKLSVIFGNINLAKFPTCRSKTALSCDGPSSQLSEWRQQLPPELQNDAESEDSGFWARMLDLTYNQHLILLHRPENSRILTNKNLAQSIAFTAAKKITSIVDDFLALGLLRQSQLHICPSLFSALTMYALMVRSADQTQRRLAEHKAGLLMLGCAEIAETWPACGWILRLFESIFGTFANKRVKLNSGNQARQGGTLSWLPSDDAQGGHQQAQRQSEEPRGSGSSSRLHNDGDRLASAAVGEGFTTSMLSEMPVHHQFLNVPDFVDADFLNGLSLDYMSGQDFLPFPMDS